MLKPLIEFCISNLADGSQKARSKLEKDVNLDVLEYGCLSYCGKCARTFFALVDGEFVEGETPDQLVENVYKQIDKNLMV